MEKEVDAEIAEGRKHINAAAAKLKGSRHHVRANFGGGDATKHFSVKERGFQ